MRFRSPIRSCGSYGIIVFDEVAKSTIIYTFDIKRHILNIGAEFPKGWILASFKQKNNRFKNVVSSIHRNAKTIQKM